MQLTELAQLLAFRAFLLRRVARYMLGEILIRCGSAAPPPFQDPLWQAGLRLNPQHIPALLYRSRYLVERRDSRGAAAFDAASAAIENRGRISASDLALTLVPQRLWHRLARQDPRREENSIQGLYAALAEQLGASPKQPVTSTETRTDSRSILRERWAKVEQEWSADRFELALEIALPLIERGDFVSPLDTVKWAERFLRINSERGSFPTETLHDVGRVADKCLAWARMWIPEVGQVWQLAAESAQRHGDLDLARRYLERAASLLPQEISIFLAQRQLENRVVLGISATTRLHVSGPAQLELDQEVGMECVMEGAEGAWEIFTLPPNGWGLAAEPRSQIIQATERAHFRVRALRPDRIRGEPWTLTFVAIRGNEYAVTSIRIAVPDSGAGRLLVLVTEDHELWEERGALSRDDVQRLLVDKSAFAADHFSPWTHMVEVGSTLALPDWAAEHHAAWTDTRDAVRAHLVEQVSKGNDIQPHLHAFNLPSSGEFPFQPAADGIHVNPGFLLTAEEHRRDFARAYSPQQRMDAVAQTVARLEGIAHNANPNYRPVLWRTGQLEFGDDAADRAWSAVALLRAGLFGDSDVPKQTFTRASLPRPAFFAGLKDPYQPEPGGPILELPVTSNLEGDFLTDRHTLCDIANRTAGALRNKPGVHVVTLLTHDKFINARRGAEEFLLDENYNEWLTLRAHLDAWREAGAERVTAQQAVQALLDDGSWHPVAWLRAASWRTPTCVQYAIRLLGKNIPVSNDDPQWVLVTIPPFLRQNLLSARVFQAGHEVPIEPNGSNAFWIRVTTREPAPECEFELRAPLQA